MYKHLTKCLFSHLLFSMIFTKLDYTLIFPTFWCVLIWTVMTTTTTRKKKSFPQKNERVWIDWNSSHVIKSLFSLLWIITSENSSNLYVWNNHNNMCLHHHLFIYYFHCAINITPYSWCHMLKSFHELTLMCWYHNFFSNTKSQCASITKKTINSAFQMNFHQMDCNIIRKNVIIFVNYCVGL